MSEIELEPFEYRLPVPYRHVSVSRTSVGVKPWYVICGAGRGNSKDYWREGEGWEFTTPTRYATAQDAARAYLNAPEAQR